MVHIFSNIVFAFQCRSVLPCNAHCILMSKKSEQESKNVLQTSKVEIEIKFSKNKLIQAGAELCQALFQLKAILLREAFQSKKYSGGGSKTSKLFLTNFLAISANLEKLSFCSFLTTNFRGGSKNPKIIFDEFFRHFSQFGLTLIFFNFLLRFLSPMFFWGRGTIFVTSYFF